MITTLATLDALLQAHRAHIGRDFTAYRNHAYRVANLCVALSPVGADRLEKIAIATAFHDLGIWTDGTFDYLVPSVRLATDHLERSGRAAWIPEIATMLLEHHKLAAYRGDRAWLVEPFRRADWIDVSMGLRTFGVSRAFIRQLYAEWPDEGFHRLLVRLSLSRWRSHPFSPLPMLRL